MSSAVVRRRWRDGRPGPAARSDPYTHYALTRSIEHRFGLPLLSPGRSVDQGGGCSGQVFGTP